MLFVNMCPTWNNFLSFIFNFILWPYFCKGNFLEQIDTVSKNTILSSLAGIMVEWIHHTSQWSFIIGFNHGLPCYVANMARGTQVDKNLFCRDWGPRAMFLI